MAAPLGRGSIAQLMIRDLWRIFMETGRRRPNEYEQTHNVMPMPSNPVKDFQVSGLGVAPLKPEGSQFTFDVPIPGGTKTYLADSYGYGFEATYEGWRDDQYAVYQDWAAQLRQGLDERAEVLAASDYNNAFSTSEIGFTAGEPLCSTAHVMLDGSTQANRPSPDVGLSVTGLQSAIIRFENLKDHRQIPRLLSSVLVLLAPENRFVAREILSSAGKPFTGDNEINSLIEDEQSWMVHHRFTSPTQWFINAAKDVHDVKLLWRDRPIMDSFDDPRTRNAVFTGYEAIAHGWSAWAGIDGSTG